MGALRLPMQMRSVRNPPLAERLGHGGNDGNRKAQKIEMVCRGQKVSGLCHGDGCFLGFVCGQVWKLEVVFNSSQK